MQRLVNDSLVLASTWIQRALSVPKVPLCSQDNTTHKFLGSKPRSLVGAGTRIIVLLDTAGFGCCTAITLCDVCLWLNCPIQKSYMIFTWFYNSPTRRQVKLTRYKRRARMGLSASDRFTSISLLTRPNTSMDSFASLFTISNAPEAEDTPEVPIDGAAMSHPGCIVA